MITSIVLSLTVGAAALAGGTLMARAAEKTKPTIVLVHGAFADFVELEWRRHSPDRRRLSRHRGCQPSEERQDRCAVCFEHFGLDPRARVLVGHSYGGEVISVAADGAKNVKALVFVAGLAPEVGEGAADLGARFPTGTLGQSLAPPVPLPDGEKDLYIDQGKFWHQFAADLPEAEAVQMAVAQRPVTEAALNERATQLSWKTIRPGSSTAHSTRTYRAPCTRSWRSAPTPRRRSR